MEVFLSVIEFVIPIVLLIIIHEFGHLVAAKLSKIEVEEFGLGFPPRLATLFTAGGTRYTLNWIPLGGFVRPKGENNPEIEGGLAAARPLVRASVYFAGPLANLLTAAVLFAFIFLQVGMPDPSRIEIVAVNENSPAERAGLLPGDIIQRVNEVTIDSARKLHDNIAKNVGRETVITYLRGDESGQVSLVPRENPPPGEGAIGIVFSHPTVPATLPQAVVLGGQAVFSQARALITLPARLLDGSISPDQARLVGYKGMYDLYQNVKESEVSTGTPPDVSRLFFFASISISLGLLNLLPIPAVDGGRILFTIPELLFRRRIPPTYENVINFISFAMLILLMIYINIQDFVNPPGF